ncbi:hypothetical protein B0T13DRAFT_454267 [Neurospora crassa]|nr:hypothetical protein B0T13DRAFT_454267 [Neurospora crassa]
MQYGQGVGGHFNNPGGEHFNNAPTGGQGATGNAQFNNGSQQPSRAQTPQGGTGGYLSSGNQQFGHHSGMQNRQGGAGGHVSPVNNNQQAGLPHAAGGVKQPPFPRNQPFPGSPYGTGGVVAQPGSGTQQFPGTQFGVLGGASGQPHHGTQPQPGHGIVTTQAVQNNNSGVLDPNAVHLPLIGSAPPEPRLPPVVTPPVFPPGTPQPDSWVAPGSGNEVVKIRAIKFRNQYGIHPQSVYYYRAHTQPWGTEYGQAGRPSANLFAYANSQPLARAELVASKVYTASQLSLFFRGEGHPNRPNRHLTLWIQNVPLLVSDRYAQKESGKCRYEDCAAKPAYTIMKGFHRIAFDEHSHHTGDYYDPYNNAGYMHLWCFEKAFDAGYLVWDVQERPHLYGFRIEADVRHHRFEEKNNASINRDHNLHDTYRQWKNEQWERYVQIRHQEARTGQRYDPYQSVNAISNDNRLWRRLTDKHVAEEVPARARNRANRNVTGNTIDNHRGDLEQFHRAKDEAKPASRAAGNKTQTGTRAGPSTPKRKRNSAAAGEDEEDEEYTETPGSKKSRTQNQSHTPPGSMGPPPPSSTTPRRSTRRASQIIVHDLNEQLGTAGESPLTRSRATFIGQQLNQLPEHLQQDVISHAPQATLQAISPVLLQNWRPEDWGAVLQERVSRMTPYHQGLLAAYAEKTEKKAQLDGGTGKRRWRSDP